MTTDADVLRRALDADRSLETLAAMIRHDSRTGGAGEAELARWLVDRMNALGLDAWLEEVDGGRFNAFGRLRGRTAGGAGLLFNGHVDTNPLSEGWTVPPWGGLVDGGFVYGLGVSNMKAGCAAYLEAARLLMDAGVEPAIDVTLSFVVGELQGGIGTVTALENGLRADYFVNCEPTDLAAVTLHAGALNFVVEVHGETRHVSKREEAADAIPAAAMLIGLVNAADAVSADVPEVHLAVNRAHVGSVHAAVSTELIESRPPQVADYARLLGTCRYGPSQSPDDVIEWLCSVAATVESAHPGVRVEVTNDTLRTGHPVMPPFEAQPESRVVRVVGEAYAAVRGVSQRTGAVAPYCYYGSDAGHLSTTAGIPGVVCGPGGQFNTMPDEKVAVADYLDMVLIDALTMANIE